MWRSLTVLAANLLTANVLAVKLAAGSPNMNGEYMISATPGAPKAKQWSGNFSNYPGGVEYFDVYHGPITSVYSQVWWTSTANAIPAEIVKRFDGKVMAIVGMESDQVMKNKDGSETSVPITW